MTDVLTRAQRSACMAAVRGRNTTPEMRVRRIAHRMGFRYALHRKNLPGSPDLVFSSRKKIIFVHGCFWHSHDCKAGQNVPASNRDYWTSKLERNARRDQRNMSLLQEDGWRILVVWECQTKDLEFSERLLHFLAP